MATDKKFEDGQLDLAMRIIAKRLDNYASSAKVKLTVAKLDTDKDFIQIQSTTAFGTLTFKLSASDLVMVKSKIVS